MLQWSQVDATVMLRWSHKFSVLSIDYDLTKVFRKVIYYRSVFSFHYKLYLKTVPILWRQNVTCQWRVDTLLSIMKVIGYGVGTFPLQVGGDLMSSRPVRSPNQIRSWLFPRYFLRPSMLLCLEKFTLFEMLTFPRNAANNEIKNCEFLKNIVVGFFKK